MHRRGKLENGRRPTLHFGKSAPNFICGHIRIQCIALAGCIGTIDDIWNTITLPTPLLGDEMAKYNIILNAFGQFLGIWAIVMIFVRETAIQTHLVKQIDHFLKPDFPNELPTSSHDEARNIDSHLCLPRTESTVLSAILKSAS
jgi:hypothetical protein